VLQVLIWAVALTSVACDANVNFNPTAPTFSNLPTGAGVRSLEISGSLTAAQGSRLEATLLYDGTELSGARTICPDVAGCDRLELTGSVRSASGHHTISFRLLGGSNEAVEYLAEGKVLMSREGLSMVTTIPLKPARATLRPGESVTFEIDFLEF